MTVAESSFASDHDEKLFLSVFYPHSDTLLGDDHFDFNASQDYNDAWQEIIHWLQLPSSSAADASSRAASTPGLDEALALVLSSESARHRLVDHVSAAAQAHQEAFLPANIEPLWNSPIATSNAEDVLSSTLDLLILFHNNLTGPLDRWLAANQRHPLVTSVTDLRSSVLERIYANALHSLPLQRIFKTVTFVLHRSICAWLLGPDPGPATSHAEATETLLVRLRRAGLGYDHGQNALAHAMNSVILSYVQSPAMKVDWVGRQSVAARLRSWIHRAFAPAAVHCLQCLTDKPDISLFESEISDWEKLALEKLAHQRMRHLFEYVRAWDHSTGAILDLKDYMQTSAESKLLLANSFSQQMARRILHAGVTTPELLSMYINVIYAFKALDSRGVLLDKVASPLRSYLRQRDNSVRVIAASFLADVDAQGNVSNPSDDVCTELAREIALSEGEEMNVDEKGLDWDDMTWVPDPIDAGPDYKKSKSDDIMSFMLTLFDRGDFIQEVQALLGERLLTQESAASELDKEIRLVELFKARFGPDGLQSCEVMLRDILESKRMNTTLRPQGTSTFPTSQEIIAALPEKGITIHGLIETFSSRIPRNDTANQQFIKLVKEVAISDKATSLLLPKPGSAPADGAPRFSTLILSSFFWPSLREDEFDVPAPISAMQRAYEQDFERVKNLRKLHWLHGLGRVAVELELEDRTVKIDSVQTWQASVIYAFQQVEGADGDTSNGSKTVQQLEESLSMDEELVRNAIAFWVAQRVLVEANEPDTYRVLETLPSEDDAPAPAPTAIPAADAAISAVKTQDAVLRDNKEMYELFIAGMLTNGGAMDPARITMMMKMVVPGGYAYGDDETKWLLAGLVEQGKVVESGSNFAIEK